MNTNPGILGRKVGMTQLVSEDGSVSAVTVIDARCVVVGKRTPERDGYTALIVGLEERRATRINKPLAGQYKTGLGTFKGEGGKPPTEEGKVKPRQILREFRCTPEFAATLNHGDPLNLDQVFKVGQFVDVRSLSRGRGFTGVMRRHNFSGAKASHGAHEYMRHGGSIGTNMTPGRVLPGRGMPGQHGNKAVSVLNQKVAQIIADQGLVLVRGGVPGSKNAVVELRGAVKKDGGLKGVS